jgi:hypothetical protein
MTQKQINFNIIDGDVFYAHELTANFTPLQFHLDFKSITPRTDPRVKTGPSFTLKHNVVTIDPWHAKSLITVLQNVVSKYESEYGKINEPTAIKKAKKKQSKQKKTAKKNKETVPSYFG